MADKLQIGHFVFPLLPRESLDFDMDRRIAKIEPAGSPSVYQDMGFDEKTLDLTGVFDGPDAWQQSEEIERLSWSGQEHVLTYGPIRKLVRIKKYKPKLKRQNRVEYSLNLIVCYPEDQIEAMANWARGGSAVAGEASPSSSGGSSYTIKSGDTLWDLAVAYYGDGTKWHSIADANGIVNERALQIGRVITIPPVNGSSPDYAGELQKIEKGAT